MVLASAKAYVQPHPMQFARPKDNIVDIFPILKVCSSTKKQKKKKGEERKRNTWLLQPKYNVLPIVSLV